MNTQENKTGGGRIILGLLFLAAGVLLLLANFGMIDGEIADLIFTWQMVIIVIGITVYINSRDFTGIVLIFIGLLFLLAKYYNFNPWSLWPLLLILFGIHILLNVRKIKPSHHFHESMPGVTKERITDDFINEVAVFSGSKKSISSDSFKGGKITTVFGGAEIDLTDCKLAEGDNILEITALFGGTTLFIPRDWKVIVKVSPLFGGFSDSRRKDPSIVFSNERVLYIKGFLMFGGGEIK